MEPDELDERYRRWRMDDLPILPEDIPLKVLPATRSQFAIVKKLMNDKDTAEVICATDAAREGELIFRYIYRMAGCKKPVRRLWISSMTDAAIRKGFEELRPAADYDALYESARCRSLADWLVGMNASRAFTLRYGALLPMGRVQTPTLALLVKRDREIAEFVPQDYWEVRADFGDFEGLYYDPETRQSRASSKEQADKIKREAQGKEGTVVESRRERKRVPPPQLFRPHRPATRGQPPLRLFRGQDAEAGAGALRAPQGHHLPAHGQPLPAAGHARKGAERPAQPAAPLPSPAQGPGVQSPYGFQTLLRRRESLRPPRHHPHRAPPRGDDGG